MTDSICIHCGHRLYYLPDMDRIVVLTESGYQPHRCLDLAWLLRRANEAREFRELLENKDCMVRLVE